MSYTFRPYTLGGPTEVEAGPSDPSNGYLTNTIVNAHRDLAFYHRGVGITYKQLTSTSTDHTDGDITNVFSDTTINLALIGPVHPANTRRRTIKVRKADLPAFPPKTTDRVEYNSIVWNVVGHVENQTEYVVEIDIEKP